MPVHVKILNLQKIELFNALEVTLSIDNQQRSFRADFKCEGGINYIQIENDNELTEIFCTLPGKIKEFFRLMRSVYAGESINFPIEFGDFPTENIQNFDE
ncbi:hypothetical protein [Nostoc sp. JL33]|uniref:hypothetical protein n=1 Tax=Nostoc sp. JL33 TaxID=2815396 RepID=UPI0025F55409|nr:hypothetical protein [Nostoc sp. JL33]MBN3872443.1 hypothetical protein [Nostoc sp. JL33]